MPAISPSNALTTPRVVTFKLALMMFIQFFVPGAWYEIGFDYIPRLGFNNQWQLPLIFGAFNIGALVAIITTQLADRVFSAEKLLAFSHFVGGVAILGLFFIRKERDEQSASFWPFFSLMLIHCVFYVPTISITNSITFTNLLAPAREFGSVRVWGTIGWIVASWPFIFILVDWANVPSLASTMFGDWVMKTLGTTVEGDVATVRKRYIFLVAGLASLLLSAFSLHLPHTPPSQIKSSVNTFAVLKAMKQLRHPFLAVLFLVTFLDAAVHQSYFFWAFTFLGPVREGGVIDIPVNWVGPVMKIGQISEIITVVFLGYVLKRLGWRLTMSIGVFGHVLRFAIFAFAPERVPGIMINAVHGICYAYFFATLYIFIDDFFPKDVRSSTQGLFNLMILGIGPFIANFVCGRLSSLYHDPLTNRLDYTSIFQFPLAIAVIGTAILLLLFHPPRKLPSSC